MTINMIDSLTQKYIDAKLLFDNSLVTTMNNAAINKSLTACLNCENELGVENDSGVFHLVESIVYYEVYNNKPCIKLFVDASTGSHVVLHAYLSVSQVQYYHEMINAMHSLTMFNVINSQ